MNSILSSLNIHHLAIIHFSIRRICTSTLIRTSLILQFLTGFAIPNPCNLISWWNLKLFIIRERSFCPFQFLIKELLFIITIILKFILSCVDCLLLAVIIWMWLLTHSLNLIIDLQSLYLRQIRVACSYFIYASSRRRFSLFMTTCRIVRGHDLSTICDLLRHNALDLEVIWDTTFIIIQRRKIIILNLIIHVVIGSQSLLLEWFFRLYFSLHYINNLR